MNVFIFHGTVGYPEENWFPWLKDELINRGIDTIVPKFPTPEDQSLSTWFDVYRRYQKQVNKDTILIGHSLGSTFILRILEQIEFSIKGSILTTPVLYHLGNPEFKKFDELNESFINQKYNWLVIKKKSRFFSVYRGDDDPYVPINQAQDTANNLGVKLNLIHQGGHLNTKAGFDKFPQLLKEVLSLYAL